MEESVKSWNCIYPVYFDKTRSVAEGRRVPKEMAVEHPTVAHVAFALEYLGITFALEESKRHPKDPMTRGRVRVNISESNKATNVHQFLRVIANTFPLISEKVAKLKKPAVAVDATVPEKKVSSSKQVETAPGVIMMPRTKKKGKRNK